MKKGRAVTMTHDYKRNGTTTLFAALDAATGKVMGLCLSRHRHRHKELLAFLKLIDGQVPKDLEVHLVLDNYGTHNHPNVKAWLAKHRRFHLHFTPTSSSWLNLVERWFRRADRQGHPPRRVPKRRSPRRRNRRLPRHPQRRPQALHLDRQRRVDHREGGARTGGPQASVRSIARHCTRSRRHERRVVRLVKSGCRGHRLQIRLRRPARA